jgi:hypothetical protein
VLQMLHDSAFWKMLIIAWVVTPLGMILVGLVFESRLVPLWRNQSKAFIPGDIGLGVVVATGWYMYPQIPDGSFWSSGRIALLIAPIVCILICFVMRKQVDVNVYSRGALNSPTKRYHDYFLYLLYMWFLVAISAPAILFGTTWSGENLTVKLHALVWFAVWLTGMVVDLQDPRMKHKITQMHVAVYRPIWRTLPPWWGELREKFG